MQSLRVDQVFGISTGVLEKSYVDRGHLDSKISKYLERNNHLAIRGTSKSGKSWLRQRLLPDAIVIQCRLGKTVSDIYREALGQLGIKLLLKDVHSRSLKGTLEAESEIGNSLLSKLKAKVGISSETSSSKERTHLRVNLEDLDYVCEILKESGRRLVIEDFHYLSRAERRRLAFDLKAMWDLGLYVVIIGVWVENNLLLDLNRDLAGRVREIAITWSDADLREILRRGAKPLNLSFSDHVESELVSISYANAGILQRLTIDTLDELGIVERKTQAQSVDGEAAVHTAAMYYAEELNTVYQTFGRNVSHGVRARKNSTGIYAHALSVILEADDSQLLRGIPIKDIYHTTHSKEPRIQQGNLKTALGNLERLQVDDDGRGLVLTFSDGLVRVVDHQLLLYRRFATVQWPWEEMIAEAEDAGEDYSDRIPADE